MILPRYEVRPATAEDVALLPQIERNAALLFKGYPADLGIPEELYATANSIETFAEAQQSGRLWVATAGGAEVVGFALVMDVEGYAHLEEIDVLPAHGGQGIGSALLATVCSWARETGYATVTLRTFRDVPWNAPFYRSRGFSIVDSAALSAAYVALEASERQRGLRTDVRVTMAYETAR